VDVSEFSLFGGVLKDVWITMILIIEEKGGTLSLPKGH
jgi:hypothetical protein